MLANKLIFLITAHFALLAHATPNLLKCAYVANLYDKRGNLVKKVCEIRENHSYENAENSCLRRGMHALVIESDEMLIELARQLEDNGMVKSVGVTWLTSFGYWINGRRHSNGQWNTYTDERLPINTDIPFTISWSHSDKCLALKKDEGKMKVSGFDCSYDYWHLCEFQVIKNDHLSCKIN